MPDLNSAEVDGSDMTTAGTPSLFANATQKNKSRGQTKQRTRRKPDDIFSVDGYDIPSTEKEFKVEKKGKGKQRLAALYADYDNEDAHLASDDAGPIGQPFHASTSLARLQDRREPSVKKRKSSVHGEYSEMPPAKHIINIHLQPKPIIKSEFKSLPQKGRPAVHIPDNESPGNSPLLTDTSHKDKELEEPAENRLQLSYPPFPSRSAPRPSAQIHTPNRIRKGGSISDILHKTGLHARSGSNHLRRMPQELSLPMFSDPPTGLSPSTPNPDNKANDFNFDGEDG